MLELETETLPFSERNEAAVLACCLMEEELVDEAAVSLVPKDFYDLRHKNLFDVLLHLRETRTPIGPITIRDEADTRFPLGVDAVGGLSFLAGLPDLVPSTVQLPHHVGVVTKKSQLRAVVTTARRVIAAVSEREGGDDEKLDEAEQTLLSLLQRRDKGGEVKLVDVVREAIGEIEQAFANVGECTGISSGFPALDRLTTGFHRGDMTVLAARPSMGKTSLAMTIAEHIAIDQDIPVAIFSLEMTAVSLMKRILSSRSEVDGHNILTGKLTERDIISLTAASGKVVSSPLFIDETAHMSIAGFSSRARRMVARHNVKMIIVDYMQLMSAKADSRVQEVTKISNGLKMSAKELNVPILVLSQLSRGVEQQNRTPRLSDLRDSGSIEQDADVVALLHRPDSSNSIVEVMVQKHRNGPTGSVDLEFDMAHTRFKTPNYFKNAKVDSK